MRKGIESDDPYKDLRVQRIEPRLEEKKKQQPEEYKPPKKNFIIVAVFYILKKFVAVFAKNFQKSLRMEKLKKSITSTKKLFETLEEKDLSHDLNFLKDISSAWKDFLKEYEFLILTKKKKDNKMDELVKQVNSFYADQEYSLGYYLAEYKEEKWHPFPFMYILNKLHTEYKEKKTYSHLSLWIASLENILETYCKSHSK